MSQPTDAGYAPVNGLEVLASFDQLSSAGFGQMRHTPGRRPRDAGWDGSARPRARAAVLPGLTHYDIFGSRHLATLTDELLG